MDGHTFSLPHIQNCTCTLTYNSLWHFHTHQWPYTNKYIATFSICDRKFKIGPVRTLHIIRNTESGTTWRALSVCVLSFSLSFDTMSTCTLMCPNAISWFVETFKWYVIKCYRIPGYSWITAFETLFIWKCLNFIFSVVWSKQNSIFPFI